MAIWPASLPQCPLMSGEAAEEKDNVIVGTIPAGQDKRRKFFTAVTTTHSVQLALTEDQYRTLRAFYKANTVTEFTWIDPEDGLPANVIFASKPTMTGRDGTDRLVSFSIEVQL